MNSLIIFISDQFSDPNNTASLVQLRIGAKFENK